MNKPGIKSNCGDPHSVQQNEAANTGVYLRPTDISFLGWGKCESDVRALINRDMRPRRR